MLGELFLVSGSSLIWTKAAVSRFRQQDTSCPFRADLARKDGQLEHSVYTFDV